MQKIKEILNNLGYKPYRYELRGNATIIDTDNGRFVIKKKKGNNDLFNYLASRSFNYYPPIVGETDEYNILSYIDQVNMPMEQKLDDMIHLVSLLHSKTTHFKEINESDYKKIYEDINNNLEYLRGYYNDVMTIIESKVFMSPSEYLLARNITKVYQALGFCKEQIEHWYELVKDKKKQRFTVVHNNLNIGHFIRNQDPYLISWDKAKIDMPIFDLYKFYLKYSLDVEFGEVLRLYEKYYPLLEDERVLLFVLMAMPSKIEFTGDEYDMCKKISKEIDTIYKTEKIISPYYMVKTKQEQDNQYQDE